jgi:hypothetical protein
MMQHLLGIEGVIMGQYPELLYTSAVVKFICSSITLQETAKDLSV